MLLRCMLVLLLIALWYGLRRYFYAAVLSPRLVPWAQRLSLAREVYYLAPWSLHRYLLDQSAYYVAGWRRLAHRLEPHPEHVWLWALGAKGPSLVWSGWLYLEIYFCPQWQWAFYGAGLLIISTLVRGLMQGLKDYTFQCPRESLFEFKQVEETSNFLYRVRPELGQDPAEENKLTYVYLSYRQRTANWLSLEEKLLAWGSALNCLLLVLWFLIIYTLLVSLC